MLKQRLFADLGFNQLLKKFYQSKVLSIELGDKKERIRAAPKDPAPSSFRFLDEIDLMESVEEKKRALKDIVKRFVPQWRHIVSKRFELVKFFAEKASLS